MYLVENEDVVGAAPTGDAPTTSEWSTILLPTKVRLILENWRYILFIKWQIELDTMSVVLCTNNQNELTAKVDDLNQCYFAIFEFEMR